MRDQENEVCNGDETETKRYKATWQIYKMAREE